MTMSLYFKLIPVSRKPRKRYTRKMYKDIVREFLSENYDLAEVIIEVGNKSYVKKRLQKSIEDMDVEHKVMVSIVNNKCFLEKY